MGNSRITFDQGLVFLGGSERQAAARSGKKEIKRLAGEWGFSDVDYPRGISTIAADKSKVVFEEYITKAISSSVVPAGAVSFQEGLTYELIGAHFAGGELYISHDESRILIEVERLKTQLIAERRATLAAKQALERAERSLDSARKQNNQLIDAICGLIKANSSASHGAALLMHQAYQGVVSEVGESQLQIAYDIEGVDVKQTYEKSQFLHHCDLSEGDEVQASFYILSTPNATNANEAIEPADRLPLFAPLAKTGDVIL